MKNFFRSIFEDRQFSRITLSTIVVITVSLLFISLRFFSLPPFIPIFNQLPWGEQRIVVKIGIFLPFGLSILVFIVNLLSSVFIYKKNPLIARLLAVTSFLLALMTLLFIIRTIQIVS